MQDLKIAQKKSKKNIYRFFAEVVVWLIICMIAWFLLARIINIPLVWLGNYIYPWLTNGVITHTELYYSAADSFKIINQQLVIYTNITPPFDLSHVKGLLTTEVVYGVGRPLVYGYGLAVFAALNLATPKAETKKWRELFIVYLVFLFIQLFGVGCEVLMQFVVRSPAEIYNHFPVIKSHVDILGSSYQMATLLIPPVTPLIFWVIFNTRYIEQLIGYKLTNVINRN